jgi:hypothetical protein
VIGRAGDDGEDGPTRGGPTGKGGPTELGENDEDGDDGEEAGEETWAADEAAEEATAGEDATGDVIPAETAEEGKKPKGNCRPEGEDDELELTGAKLSRDDEESDGKGAGAGQQARLMA